MKEYTEQELKLVVSTSKSYHEVLKHFGRNTSSAAYKQLNRLLTKYDIPIDHFLGRSEFMKLAYKEGRLAKLSNDEIFCVGSISRKTVKNRLIDEKLIPYVCTLCGQDDEWNGKKISLILDHVNGINNDNRIENLRFVCPNCNSTLDTHCKGSKGLKVKEKKIRKIANRTHLRKVERPTLSTLLEEVDIAGYCETGRKYGVSDNAIRKWIKQYKQTQITLSNGRV